MKALVATGDERLVEIREVVAPVVGPGELLVEVKATSVNRGELSRLIAARPGWRPGWDFAGLVRASGAGQPPQGSPVFGMLPSGSWAELVAVAVDACAVMPSGLPAVNAAALPAAGLTALRLTRLAGPLAERRVLVTGAAGGVGRFLIQLCRRAGARVTAQAGCRERAKGLTGLGAEQITVPGEASPGDSYDVIFDSVGGASLLESITQAAPGGLILTYGNSSHSASAFSVSDFYPKQLTLRGFHLLEDLKLHPCADDLTELGARAAAGTLQVDVDVVCEWTDAAAALDSLRRRTVAGKAVLRLP